jgi:sec-independent protein translocase protein TatC
MTQPKKSPSDPAPAGGLSIIKDNIGSFWGHLEDLRRRIIRSLIAFIIASVLFYPSAGAFLSILIAPAGKLVFLSPADAFTAYWSVVLLGGLACSLPYICYQLWGFVAEGLMPGERRLVGFYGILSFVLFILGALFAYFVMIPMAYQFLLGYSTARIVPMITLDRYLSFLITFVLSFAIAFELPLVVFALARFGIVSPEVLVSGRRYAIVIILIIAAILTPPDVVSQILLAGPMLVLYELGIVLAKIGGRPGRGSRG